MSASPRICGNCGHGNPVPAMLGQLIECHGAPPQLVAGRDGLASVFPACRVDWWCGAWTPKPSQIYPPNTPETTEKPTGDSHGKT